ncbi:activating transcription factor of chaperone isoform X2 [Drosophila navojoa]|uniref:activating transcription factor of chaperone isoform X2 n=1 Tax=Drosophila navojoa TaxID=7232 RepID=UPI0011BF3189|nr:activating transcription factor of chaperone isoform X2 [Drosophila navojoa]
MSCYIYMQQAYECLLDQKASHYIDYETSTFPQQLDVVQPDMLPETKVQEANAAMASDFQHADASMILQQLTPPQSPPQFEAQIPQQQPLEQPIKQESKQLQYATDAIPTTTTAGAAYGFNNWLPENEIIRETQLVDDIVNMRAQELQLPINWQQYNDDCESQASSTMCSSSSRSSSSISSSSSSSSSPSPSSSIADADEDWLPGSSSSSPIHNSGEEQLPAKGAKKRTRAYGRGVEDRKIRKKEQNKNAATRYRQKKKQEMEHVLGEEQQLQQTNAQLRRQLNDRLNESRYLRQLIREFYKDRQQ